MLRKSVLLIIASVFACGGRIEASAGVDGSLDGDSGLTDTGDLGVPDSDTGIVTIVAGQSPLALALDESYVYWTNRPSTVMRCLKTGSTEAVSVATGQDNPELIAVDDGGVYWTTEGGLFRADKSGSTPKAFPTSAPPISFTLDLAYIFWADTTGGIFRCSKIDCTAPVELAAGQFSAGGLVSDGATLYWQVGHLAQSIVRCPTTGCVNGPAPAIESAAISSFCIDGDNINWMAIQPTYPGVSNVYQCPKAECSSPALVGYVNNNDGVEPRCDGSNLFWSDSLQHHIFKCDESGGLAATFGPAWKDVGDIAVDANSIFVIADDSIVRLAK